MSETMNVEFTKDEWRAVSVLIRHHMKGTNIEDLNEKRQKLKTLLASYERERGQLEREEIISKTYQSILDKIDRKV